MAEIILKGRTVPLLYTVYEMKQIQEEIAPINRAMAIILGKNPDDEEDLSLYMGAKHLEAAAKLIKILGNAGLEEAGENPDLTEKKILRALKPVDMIEAITFCMDAMAEGMASEIPAKKETGPVDVVLEEIKKNETADE